MKRTDIVPGQAYLAARGNDAAQGGGYRRRRVIVLDNQPYIKTFDRPARPGEKDWNGEIRYPAVPARPAATTSFVFPLLPEGKKVTIRAVPDPSRRGTYLPVLAEGRDWAGVPTGNWDVEYVTSREIVDTWEHAEEVVAARKESTRVAIEAAKARRVAAEARLEALEGRLGAFGMESPLRVASGSIVLRYDADGAKVAALLESLVGYLERALDDAV